MLKHRPKKDGIKRDVASNHLNARKDANALHLPGTQGTQYLMNSILQNINF